MKQRAQWIAKILGRFERFLKTFGGAKIIKLKESIEGKQATSWELTHAKESQVDFVLPINVFNLPLGHV
jgi:hypothetical protein